MLYRRKAFMDDGSFSGPWLLVGGGDAIVLSNCALYVFHNPPLLLEYLLSSFEFLFQ
jgi:hypothetical protein